MKTVITAITEGIIAIIVQTEKETATITGKTTEISVKDEITEKTVTIVTTVEEEISTAETIEEAGREASRIVRARIGLSGAEMEMAVR